MIDIEKEIVESLANQMMAATDFEIVNSDKYPVSVKLTNEQWNWLCDTIGKPQLDWKYNFGQIWFNEEKHKTLWLLRWS